MFNKIKNCIECGKPAVWVRSTQFAGEHPYCLECVLKEGDFMEDDPSYRLWYKLSEDEDQA